MDTLLDMLNYIINLYKEATEHYDFDDEEDPFDNIDIFNEVYQSIMETAISASDKFEDLISLLAINYYIIVLGYSDLDDITDYESLIIKDMLSADKEDFVRRISEQENEYLIDFLDCVFEEQIQCCDEYDLEDGLDDYDEWDCFEEIINDYPNETKLIFEKFHPNLAKDKEGFKKNKKREIYWKKLVDTEINSFDEFMSLFLMARLLLGTKNNMSLFISEIINRLSTNNPILLNEIVIFILKYYYVYSLFYQKYSEEVLLCDIEIIMKDVKKITGFDDILLIFFEYDPILFENMMKALSDERKHLLGEKLKLTK